jgi:hypothetical protein
MYQQFKFSAVIAWFLCGVACLAALFSVGDLWIQHGQSENILKLIGDAVWSLLPVPFAITAALIVSRQRGNIIGWLLMVPACLTIISAPIDYYMRSITTPPANPGFPLLLMAWFSNWNWLALIFPLLLIPLLFPTGHLLSARWRWAVILAAAMCAIFLFNATFSKALSPGNADWSVLNPIGFLEESFFQSILIFWFAGLMVMTLSSAASLFVRYRRTGKVEREQIKWLLYACGVFAVIYIPGLWINDLSRDDNSIYANLFNLLLGLEITTFPISIAIAILRYHLWDIDLIIRRTLQYGLLTVLLGLVYFGMIVLLGQVFRAITGQDSPLVVVLSTLSIAALFTPLRRRLQSLIDRRFFRRKYDAARALEEFSAAARREVELQRLTSHLVGVVEQTVSPEEVWVWLKD